MASPDAKHWVVYNGEIYNFVELRAELEAKGHRFRTTSDTEVLLAGYAEWGSECVRHFNGMFAFALWDVRERVLFCAIEVLDGLVEGADRRTVQLLLGHTKIESTVRYLGIEVDDALAIAEQVDV